MGLIPTKTWTLLESLQRRNSYKDKKIAPNFLCNKSAHQAAKVHPLINWLCQFNIRTEPIPTTESNETLFWNILPASSTGGLTGGTLALLKCSDSAFAFLTPSLGGTSRLTQRCVATSKWRNSGFSFKENEWHRPVCFTSCDFCSQRRMRRGESLFQTNTLAPLAADRQCARQGNPPQYRKTEDKSERRRKM